MTVKIKTSGYANQEIKKKVTIFTNDPSTNRQKLIVSGKVIAAAIIEPKSALLNGEVGKPIQAVVTVTAAKGNPFEIIGSKADKDENIRFRLEKMGRPKDSQYALYIENLKKEAGRYYDVITLTTNSEISPELKIRIIGIIRNPSQ